MRETMNKKKDRGAAKTVNFCLAGDTRILTQKGEKQLREVQPDDLLWDGTTWVEHHGLKHYGKKITITYSGLRGTPGHIVWTYAGITTLLDAACTGTPLFRTMWEGRKVHVAGVRSNISGYTRELRQATEAFCACGLPTLWEILLQVAGKPGARTWRELPLYSARKVQASESCYLTAAWTMLQLYDTAVREEFARQLKKLQRVRNQGGVQISGGVRPNRQRRKLLQDKSATCVLISKQTQHQAALQSTQAGGRVFSGSPGVYLQSCNAVQSVSARNERRRNPKEIRALITYLQAEAEILKSRLETGVYDLVDAGELHRFTANGFLVSNSSSYGGTATSIARKIEQDTGVKMSPEDAQLLLDAVEARQETATRWFKKLEEAPKKQLYLRAMSGRRRHLHTLGGGGLVDGLSARTVQGELSALGRECRNYFLQESVGAVAALASARIVRFLMKHPELDMQLVVCLYDSLLIMCPPNQRRIADKLLQLHMYLGNGWYCENSDRILTYTIDLEHNAGWSTAPSAEMHTKLENPDWEPTPEHLKPLEEFLDAKIDLMRENPELAVYNKWDMPADMQP